MSGQRWVYKNHKKKKVSPKKSHICSSNMINKIKIVIKTNKHVFYNHIHIKCITKALTKIIKNLALLVCELQGISWKVGFLVSPTV